MKKDLDFSAIFSMSDAMKLAGYEGLPGGRELIAKVEERETAASIEPLSEESPESAIERTTAPPARFSSPGESQ